MNPPSAGYGNLDRMRAAASSPGGSIASALREGSPVFGWHIRRSAALRASLALLLAGILAQIPFRASGQDQPGTPSEETVANLAAGRVIIAVVKDAILIATVENPIEAETRPPTPVVVSSQRAGILLGADNWLSPSSKQEIAELDAELPHLRSHLLPSAPHLQAEQGGGEATDIEAIGQGLLERLNEVAQNLHGKVNLSANEPVTELILVGYLPGYGPDIWQLSYQIKQEEQNLDYWTTRVLRPSYLQFWPPEKGQPRTLLEFSYPSDNAPKPLLELLRQKDPRIEQIVGSDPKMGEVASHFLEGESTKVLAVDATQFLRAVLSVIAPSNARETMCSIREDNGLEWILAPPPEPPAPGYRPERSPGAPSLSGAPKQ
jgi:hypothetical protein